MDATLTSVRGLVALDAAQAACIAGGLDKGAQEALYMIGYAIGYVSKLISKIYLYFRNLV